ncbi:membrane metallo-endopeptidase-like 1 [Cloeon dipterum]|uniref:membrane metallo-endopeptidase-like 1 n=1 Tax=Cloeon dipterum TaxID=197152 RepID=UPI00321F839C
MGTVLAHEFTHGFDDEGRTYDESGDDKDWWSDVALNSVETFDEDIADNGGVSLSYRAYKRLNAKKEKLKDLEEYTDEQLFFIGYANSFCRSETVEFTEHTIKADEHSPPKYRVNVPLSNMKEFADAFQCREGSNMNPRREKCKIW